MSTSLNTKNHVEHCLACQINLLIHILIYNLCYALYKVQPICNSSSVLIVISLVTFFKPIHSVLSETKTFVTQQLVIRHMSTLFIAHHPKQYNTSSLSVQLKVLSLFSFRTLHFPIRYIYIYMNKCFSSLNVSYF